MINLLVLVFGFYSLVWATPPAGEQIIGLVEVPFIFGVADPEGLPEQTLPTPKKTKALNLFMEPNEKSAVVVSFTKSADVESKEHGYEEVSAVVYKEEKGWYLIRTKGKSGWLRPADAGTFRAYESLIKDGMAYLEDSWNHQLFEKPEDLKKFIEVKKTKSPNEAAAEEDSTDSDTFEVEILSTRRVKDELWFEVQLIEGRCGGKEKTLEKGWVPAYNSKNKPNLWYHSRGC